MRNIQEILSDPTLTEAQAAFVALVSGHDLTYNFSDDFRAWSVGEATYTQIVSQARNFDRTFVVEVWNASVDRKVVPASREQFYWKVGV